MTTTTRLDWQTLTTDQIHHVVREGLQQLADREPDQPEPGLLQRSIQLEETQRAATRVQHVYTGLIQDAFNTPNLRHTIEQPEGKTAFRDPADLIAKTHGIRAYEANSRIRLTAALTPARHTDPERETPVGTTQLPLLAAFQGRVHPSKLASALAMITEVDENAQAAGKDPAFRTKLRGVIEKDFAEKIEHTTPEEFSRYVSQRKKDVLASIDPADQQFTQTQTDAMYDVKRIGPVRGNKNAIEYRVITDAEGDEVLQTLLTSATNLRGTDEKDTEFTARSWGHRKMHVLRDALKFVIANIEKTGFRGASGAHTQMVVIADYATLLDGVRQELKDHLPEISAEQRETLLAHLSQTQGTSPPETFPNSHPLAKTTQVEDILDDDNLDRIHPRITQGIYTTDIPPSVILRLRCDVGITPITLTGDQRILSVGRTTRQFPDHIRRAILARDRGCAVPGCHIPASLCEVHHHQYWSDGGETSADNGVLLCSHHHAAIHAEAIKITKVDGKFRFIMPSVIDRDQKPRKNYFYQS